MLSEFLKKNKCFKLVCGAGNEDTAEVEKLVFIYSKAGCNLFDVAANLKTVEAAKNGIKKSGIKQNKFICVSVGIKGDPHVSKAFINKKNCVKCKKCLKICPQNAIIQSGIELEVNNMRCIGCGRCFQICNKNCIEMQSKLKDLSEILPPIISKGIDCVEFHALSEDANEIFIKWKEINGLYNGLLSLCVDRSKMGSENLIKNVNRMLALRKPYTTIIQADGAPMSGGCDDYKTTLQAVATAEIFQNAKMPVYILLSGGTNSKSSKLAKLCDININGVAVGSYARKIVKKYIEREDFWHNEKVINEAVQIAKKLVDKTIKYMEG